MCILLHVLDPVHILLVAIYAQGVFHLNTWKMKSYGCGKELPAERQYTGMEGVDLGVGCGKTTLRQLVDPEGSSHPSHAIQ